MSSWKMSNGPRPDTDHSCRNIVWLLVAALMCLPLLEAVHPFSYYVNHARKGYGRNIQPLPCATKKGDTGVCMFAWDCMKANGTHLGTCIERFYFGSCCKLKPGAQRPVHTPMKTDIIVLATTSEPETTDTDVTVPPQSVTGSNLLGMVSGQIDIGSNIPETSSLSPVISDTSDVEEALGVGQAALPVFPSEAQETGTHPQSPSKLDMEAIEQQMVKEDEINHVTTAEENYLNGTNVSTNDQTSATVADTQSFTEKDPTYLTSGEAQSTVTEAFGAAQTPAVTEQTEASSDNDQENANVIVGNLEQDSLVNQEKDGAADDKEKVSTAGEQIITSHEVSHGADDQNKVTEVTSRPSQDSDGQLTSVGVTNVTSVEFEDETLATEAPVEASQSTHELTIPENEESSFTPAEESSDGNSLTSVVPGTQVTEAPSDSGFPSSSDKEEVSSPEVTESSITGTDSTLYLEISTETSVSIDGSSPVSSSKPVDENGSKLQTSETELSKPQTSEVDEIAQSTDETDVQDTTTESQQTESTFVTETGFTQSGSDSGSQSDSDDSSSKNHTVGAGSATSVPESAGSQIVAENEINVGENSISSAVAPADAIEGGTTGDDKESASISDGVPSVGDKEAGASEVIAGVDDEADSVAGGSAGIDTNVPSSSVPEDTASETDQMVISVTSEPESGTETPDDIALINASEASPSESLTGDTSTDSSSSIDNTIVPGIQIVPASIGLTNETISIDSPIESNDEASESSVTQDETSGNDSTTTIPEVATVVDFVPAVPSSGETPTTESSPVEGEPSDVQSTGSEVSDPDETGTVVVGIDAQLPNRTQQKPSFETQEDQLLHRLNTSSFREICGQPVYPSRRIVGGSQASFGEWPWQVSLRQWRSVTYLHKCGAALVNENWAITAAHCVENVQPDQLLLRLGEFDLERADEPYGHVERKVQIIATHPQFDPRTFEYDLALLRFNEPVSFQPNIIPICIPDDDYDFIGDTGFVSGWGRLYEDGPLPSLMQKVPVPVITNSECEVMYRNAGYIEDIPNIFICAGYELGRRDSCEGDSGGPLVIQHKDSWKLAGVISWGIGCALPNQPGVYTRISAFREWINKIIVF
ncbi:hypothetical protein HAZT_HAZT005536 [Hyalella azteca]|uniref:Serine protease filzig isoform X1 n=1 Tax=Hyalella azteca TaxID=294128 RepID=A0A6A0HCD9_HYAAZ|nr:serine protease filzig isoform X1 [Hyalella azteca]KAA0202934.1 hypothetical protein HAZT_HAZT005536 [Hyalella azteca]